MATDKKISELPVATSIDPADVSVLVDNGTDYQFAFSTLLSFIGSSLNLGANISFGSTLPQNTSGKNGDVFINTSAGNFAQKTSGEWTIVYTLPSTTGSTDGTVLYGLGVPGNATGNNNDTYINTGTGVFYKKSAGTWSQAFSMQTGPTGPAGTAGTNGINGTNGKTILNGSTDPSNISTGTDGDFYINTATFMFFGPKTNGVWSAGTSLAGADGLTGLIGPKGDKGDTGAAGPGVPTGGTTGQVLAKADGTDGNTQWITTGGSPGGSNKQIQYNNAGILDGDNNLRYDNTTKSIYLGNPPSYSTPTGNIYFFGDSITSGTGATTGNSYSNLVSASLGLTENNFGVSGCTLEKQSPVDPFGSPNMVDRISSIPTKGISDKWLVFMFGINDWQYAGANYTPANFIVDYTTIINAAISKGWSASNIIITSLTFPDPANFSTVGLGGGIRTLASLQAFNAAAQGVATALGLTYVELNNYLSNRGGSINLHDLIHPNALGHALYAKAIANTIINQIYANGQTIAANGIAEFLKLVYKTNNVISNSAGSLLGVDKYGVIGILNDLPINFTLNNPILQNGLLQALASLPNSFGLNDILLKQDTLLTSALDDQSGTIWNSIKVADGAGNMNFYLNFINGMFRFWNKNGTTPAFAIDRDGTIVTGGSASDVGNPGHIPGNVVVPNNSGLSSNIAGSYGSFIPETDQGYTLIKNTWQSGRIRAFMSNGANGAEVEMQNMWNDGSVTMQNGGTHVKNPIGRLSLYSTSQGFLPPQMATAQRNAMGFITAITFTGGGSGFTSPPTVVFSGGGGSGAAAIVTINSSGQLDGGFTIINPGTGYTSAPSVTFSGGGGTAPAGGSIISLQSNTGLLILNIDTGCLEFWNGSAWVSLVDTVIDTTATPYTKATINAVYPNATVGFKVIADAAGFTYTKKDNSLTGNWAAVASTTLS